MQIDIKDVISGKLDGRVVWICDFRFKDISNKPIRHIKPKEVLIRSNKEVTKRVYYSESHFSEINSKGLPVKTSIIPPYDNTGYRSYRGVALNVFDNKEECVAMYNKLALDNLKAVDRWFKDIEIRYSLLKRECQPL